MLLKTDSITYKRLFPSDPHPFISQSFIELNRKKADEIIYLTSDDEGSTLGMIAGIKGNIIKSPFSAPFGGFHFRKENIYVSDIVKFLSSLKEFVEEHGLEMVEIIIPPDLYHGTFNSKVINSFLRLGFQMTVPEITNWVSLDHFNGMFVQKNSREYYRQAVRNGLSFESATSESDREEIYDLISTNRAKNGRPIYMTLQDILDTSVLWPIDFFKVLTKEKGIVASGIFYRYHPEICYAAFWGDNDLGRPLRAMDYLSLSLWTHYKNLGYKYIDLGISTENGSPNEGLLRFKETHEAVSSLRYKFYWQSPSK